MNHHKDCLFHVEVASRKKLKGNICIMRNTSHLRPYSKNDTIMFFGLNDDVQAAITINDFYLLMLGLLNMPLKLVVKGLLI
jgi:hypothetical protein